MSKNLHIVPHNPFDIYNFKTTVPIDQKFEANTGVLTLPKADSFTVSIKEYLDEIKKIDNTVLQKQSIVNRDNKKIHDEVDTLLASKKKIYEKYNDVNWAWQLVGDGIKEPPRHNANFKQGISSFTPDINGVKKYREIKFPKLLEGGGLAWLEVFTKNDPATGKLPDGMFVKATGKPKIITAEWKDADENKIKGKVAFGSTIYLHIYTEALYGQEINILLRDTKYINANLTPTPSDENGHPIQSLKDKSFKHFTRNVDCHQYDSSKPQTIPPAGSITDQLIQAKKQTYIQNVQKCVFAVFIEQAWSFQGAGSNYDYKDTLSFDSGNELEINPFIFHKNLDKGVTEINAVLKVSRTDGKMYKGELTGNKPVLVGKTELNNPNRDNKKVKNYTFGVFIDGTMNSKYNTMARISWEKKRIGEKNNVYSEKEHLKNYAKSSKEVGDGKSSLNGQDYEYKYDQTSYENDLSNTAILHQNFKDDANSDPLNPRFKIYTEGMGTNTLADGDGKVGEWVSDDYFEGSAFGVGNAGIVDRVTRAVEQMEARINIETGQKIGTITVDVFGFSRGSAAARHFVHEIMLRPYAGSMGFNVPCVDHSGRKVDIKYLKELLPEHGYLGYMLTQKGFFFNKLIIRFAGLYDTVAHRGIYQGNDVKELGLNSISKAQHILHITAGDEHRKQFSLSRIIRKKNHIELNFPGVHCDVGGSYVEGRPEGNAPNTPKDPAGEHIIAQVYLKNLPGRIMLNNFRETLINEGWFLPNQIEVNSNVSVVSLSPGLKSNLESFRSYVSNNYSFVPLHILCKYGIEKGLPFDFDTLKAEKNFNKDSMILMTKIKSYLDEYMTKVIASPTADIKYEIPEVELKHLRNRYLHYNAVVGVVNGPEDDRKRYIIPA